MFRACHYLKVFDSVVLYVTVDVVNDLIRQKVSPYVLFSFQAMLSYIPLALCKWMLWRVYEDISRRMNRKVLVSTPD